MKSPTTSAQPIENCRRSAPSQAAPNCRSLATKTTKSPARQVQWTPHIEPAPLAARATPPGCACPRPDPRPNPGNCSPPECYSPANHNQAPATPHPPSPHPLVHSKCSPPRQSRKTAPQTHPPAHCKPMDKARRYTAKHSTHSPRRPPATTNRRTG